jgi:restriction system protein
MAVPDFQSFFKPLLELAADGKEHSVREAREIIAKNMTLSEADLSELLPSGTQTKFDNRVAWGKSYFVQAKVLESTRRGYFRITDRGRELLAKGHPELIFASWTSTLNLLNFIRRIVILRVKPFQRLLRHRQKHQKKSYRKHIKTFVMNWVPNYLTV